MNIAIIMSAIQYGATVANGVEVTEVLKDGAGRVTGARMRDVFSGKNWSVKAKVGPIPALATLIRLKLVL